ncbi:phage tail tape measure protein [Agromyces sp. NPDC055658]
MAQYVSGMQKAAKATKDTTTEAGKLAAQKEAFDAVGKASLAIGTLAAVGVGLAVSKFADFDRQMSAVQAASHESTQNMAAFRQAAIDAGEGTAYTASEAAGAIEELGKAGVETADILGGGLTGSLNLAAAGGLEVARSAEVAADALNQFNLSGADLPHVADLFAAGAGKASGSVEDLAQAMGQVGQVAHGTGLSIEETTAGLAAFASQGLKGSDAGTSFKTMLGALTPNSAKAAAEMERLGISAYDSGGSFVGLAKFAGSLHGALAGLTDQQRNASLEIIFGQDAIRAANVLYSEGEAGINKWTKAVDDSGYASETARMRMDNLSGDIEKLGGAIDTTLIQSGSAANDALRALVQAATGAVDAIGDLPEPVLGVGTAMGGLTAAVGLAGGAALLAIPKMAELKASMSALGISGGQAAKGVGLAGGAISVAGLALAAWASEAAQASAKTDAFVTTLDEATGRVTESTREMVIENLAAKDSFLWIEASDSAYSAAEKIGLGIDTVTEAAMGNVDAMREVEKVTLDSATRGLEYANASKIVVDAVRGESASIADAISMAEQKNRAQADGVEVSKSAADAYLDAASGAKELSSQISELIDQINEANGVGQDAVSQNLDYKNALAEVDETIKNAKDGVEGYALGLDENTQAGRDNKAMLVDLAQQSQEAAKAQFDLDGNTKTYRETLEAGQQTLIDRAKQLGYNADEAGALADQIYRIPDSSEWRVIAETAAAQAALDGFIRDYSGRQIPLYVQAIKDMSGRPMNVGQYADGGLVTGPGGPREDNIPAMLSDGEFVVNANAAQKNLALLSMINSGGETSHWEAFTKGAQRYEASPATYAYSMPAPAAPAASPAAYGPTNLSPLDRQLLREIRDRVGVTVPMGAIQASIGSTSVANSRRGRA